MSLNEKSKVALVSMPWMAPGLPSIQLGTLAAVLNRNHIDCRSYEFFLDYAAEIGVRLYNILSNAGGFIEEWLFAQHYYKHETGNDLRSFRSNRPPFGLGDFALEEQTLDVLVPVTDQFLEELAMRPEWAGHDIVGFSLTISQTASSMALARLLKRRFAELTIIFGGSACAGPMGPALLAVCPYVDVVVSVEGEAILPKLVQRLREGLSPNDMPGVLWRDLDGSTRGSVGGPILTQKEDLSIAFDEYFVRLDSLGLRDSIEVWLPFESSRGCWWGEKHQCTFCGLHEIMQFRSRSWDTVLAEMEKLAERHQIKRFFAVDLIMPTNFLRTFLPEIVRRRHEWSLFYEVKANLKRSDMEVLAEAGVRWIQPGIESLDNEILKLMDKGVTAIQNVQVLKWCRELDIRVTWNIITGTPMEPPQAYQSMAALIPSLFHLTPPSGASPFQLHRFSPFFENPHGYGIERIGAHRLYRHIFPIEQNLLDDFVYLHDYCVPGGEEPEIYTRPVQEAIAMWQAAFSRGARLVIRSFDSGRGEIVDSRILPEKTYRLSESEMTLYKFLDPAKPETKLLSDFSKAFPECFASLGSDHEITKLILHWHSLGLVMLHSGQIFALALQEGPSKQGEKGRSLKLHAPVSYLGNSSP